MTELNIATYNEAKQHLLYVCNLLSPSGKEQKGFVALVLEMEQASEKGSTIIQAVVNRLADGINYGNWPK